jgi:TonB-linked SusC/RagA family outer membrane protein
MRDRLRKPVAALVVIGLCVAGGAAHAKPAKAKATRKITGVVLDDASNAPVAGVKITLKDSRLSATSGADGSFTLAKAPTTDGELGVAGEGVEPTAVPVLAGEDTSITVLVTRAAPARDGKDTKGKERAASEPRGRQIAGLVRDQGGAPIAGATVTVRGTELTALTDADGMFVLPAVKPGEVDLDVVAPAFAAGSVRVGRDTTAAKIALRPDGTAPVAAPATPAASPDRAPTDATTSPAPAATRSVRGQVLERGSQTPVPGAIVQVAGTEIMALTDEHGRFELTGVAGHEVVVSITATGYAPVELSSRPGTGELLARLAVEASGGATAPGEQIHIEGRDPVLTKQNLAYGASVVEDEDLNRVSASNLDAALSGKVAGANIQSNSGAPGGGTQLRLRGISTINGQSSALYVIDGILVSNSAISSGVGAISAAGSASQDNPVNRIADLNPNDIENVEILKGPAAAALYGSKAANGVVVITTKRGRAGTVAVDVTQRVGVAQLSNKLGSRRFGSRQEVMDTYGDEAIADLYTGETYDHEAALTRTPIAYETIASASGGTDTTTYAGSVLVRDEPGVVTGTFAAKQSGRLSLGYKLGKLKLNASTNLLHSTSDRGLTNNDNTGTSLYVALSSTPSFLDLSRRSDGTFPINPLAPSNPLQTVALFQNEEDVWRLLGSTSASYELWQDAKHDVRLTGNLGVDRFQQRNDLLSPPELQFEGDDGLLGTSIDATASSLNYNLGVGGTWTFTPTSNKFKSALTGGLTYEAVDRTTVYVTAENLTGGQPQVDSATSVQVAEGRLRTLDQGAFVQEELLTLQERLSLIGGLLLERSSLNGNTARFFLFPKLAAAYKLPLESDLVDTFRVRAAYGEAGNRPNYGQKFTSLNATATIDGTAGLLLGGVAGDPDIEPERQRELELGTDLILGEQRFVLELSAYQRNISNLLLQRTLPTSTGFGTQFENGGTMRDRGLEATVSGRPVVGAVDWKTGATLTLNRSQIVDLPGEAFNLPGVGFGADAGAYRIEEGKSATQIVSDVDGDGVLDVIGDGEPDYRVGWTNEVKLGRFGLNTLVDWQQGSSIINLTRNMFDANGTSADYLEGHVDDPDGDGPMEGVLGKGEQRLATANMGDIRPYIEDATFVKLREVSLSYDVPKSTAAFFALERASLSLSGRNLLTLTDYSGLDPEVSNFGNQAIGRNYDLAPYPPSRSYWLSLTAGF